MLMHFASTHPPNPVLKLKAHEFEDVPPMAEDHVPDKNLVARLWACL